jgi:hypothetical protein
MSSLVMLSFTLGGSYPQVGFMASLEGFSEDGVEFIIVVSSEVYVVGFLHQIQRPCFFRSRFWS